ncbi:MAG TPA: Xaa-Pro peptidase family protein [Acidimicrobiales bacterium]|jgi:Xaa-Pro aminopeptidase|nr:Xaa-Pro peptidase family protein [Acidimicrobiales bacterium]
MTDELPPMPVTGRLDRVRQLFAAIDGDGATIDALLVTTPANIRWLTGFSGSAGLLMVTAGGAVLTTDGRYRTQSAEQLRGAGVGDDVSIVVGGVQAQREGLNEAVKSAARIGLEADDVTWAAQRSWSEIFASAELFPTRGVVEGLRVVKDANEILRMERAAAIADQALAEVLPLLAAVGSGNPAGGALTESRFAAALDHAMRVAGAEDSAFETIVASGENSAKPHARPGPRRIRPGDPVVVDFGAIFDGYRSDMTRTFSVGGEPTGELARVFSVVAESQRAGVAAVRPGAETGAVDLTCRQVIDEAGWAERFEHGTGHGVGLDIHEAPSVGPGSTAILSPGAVITVEPGVYLPDTGGVRIEDTLVVTEDGSRSLTQFPKEVPV